MSLHNTEFITSNLQYLFYKIHINYLENVQCKEIKSQDWHIQENVQTVTGKFTRPAVD